MDKSSLMQHIIGLAMMSLSVYFESVELAIFGASLVLLVGINNLNNTIQINKK